MTAAGTVAATALATGGAGIDHIIVVMMENRSFDHFLGWMPGADGKQSGLSYTDRYGIPHSTHHLTDFQGCGHPDPDHSYEGGRIQYNNGKNNGWLRAGENDEFAVGYYDAADLDFWRQAGPDWTVCDQYFAATMAETYPNRFYQHSAATDRMGGWLGNRPCHGRRGNCSAWVRAPWSSPPTAAPCPTTAPATSAPKAARKTLRESSSPAPTVRPYASSGKASI